MALTDVAIRQIKAPPEKPMKLFDSGGLYLLIKPNGSKYWRLKYRYAGKEKVLALGVYPEVSLGNAREQRDEARRKLKDSADPCVQKKQNRIAAIIAANNTFESVANEWLDKQRPRWSLKHTTKIERAFKRYVLPEIGARY